MSSCTRVPDRSGLLLRLGLPALAMILVAACAATRGRRSAEESGFLGDYSQLQKNPKYPHAEIWVDEEAPSSSYDSVMLDSVGVRVKKGDEGRLTPRRIRC